MGFSPRLIHSMAGDEASFCVHLEKVIDLGTSKGRSILFHLMDDKERKKDVNMQLNKYEIIW